MDIEFINMGEEILRANGYSYVRLSEDDVPEVAFFIASNHLRSFPMICYYHISFKNCLNLVLAIVSSKQVQRYSVKIVHQETKKLVGTLLGVPKDGYAKSLPTEDTLRSFEPYKKDFFGCSDKLLLENRLDIRNGIELKFLRILPDHYGNKFVQNLLVCLEYLAKRDGFSFMYAELVGKRPQQIFRKSGFKGIVEAKFRDIDIEGAKLFCGLDESIELAYKVFKHDYRL